jgi:hypothetical protein
MKVVVQQMHTDVFLNARGQWSAARPEAAEFKNPLDAIAFCIRFKARDVRLVTYGNTGEDVYLYPFGGDPLQKAELKKLRKVTRESRRLKAERRIIEARIDGLLAQSKEVRKQFPFARKPISGD